MYKRQLLHYLIISQDLDEAHMFHVIIFNVNTQSLYYSTASETSISTFEVWWIKPISGPDQIVNVKGSNKMEIVSQPKILLWNSSAVNAHRLTAYSAIRFIQIP